MNFAFPIKAQSILWRFDVDTALTIPRTYKAIVAELYYPRAKQEIVISHVVEVPGQFHS